MKKFLVTGFLGLVMFSCADKNNDKPKEEFFHEEVEVTEVTKDSVYFSNGLSVHKNLGQDEVEIGDVVVLEFKKTTKKK